MPPRLAHPRDLWKLKEKRGQIYFLKCYVEVNVNV